MTATTNQQPEPHSWAYSRAAGQALGHVDRGRMRARPAAQIVVDAGATMPVWWPLLPEFYRMAALTGGFEGFNVSVLTSDGRVRGCQLAAPTLVVSDCMGPQWRPGPAGDRWFRTLHSWARQLLVSVVQPLPERMWKRTALRGTAGVIRTPAAGSANTALRFTPYDQQAAGALGGLPVPVVEASPQWLENWSSLVSGPAAAEVPAYVAPVSPAPAPHQGRPLRPADMSAEELVLNFRATASPEAFSLAGHLAVGITELPVMQRVQHAVEPQPNPIHLAEVITSGMLRAIPGTPGRYLFRDGVCELLLHSLSRTEFARTASVLIKAGTELAAASKATVALAPSLALLSSAGLQRLQAV